MSTFRIDNSESQKSFSGTQSRIQLWTRFLDIIQAEKVCEVGVWKGGFAGALLAKCSSIRQYYMLDPWQNLPDWNKPFNLESSAFEEVLAEAMSNTKFAASKRCVLRGTTKEVSGQIPDGSLDFVYVDGDHTLRGITIDLMAMWPKVRDGGFIGGDDFYTDPFLHGNQYEPTFVCPYAVYFAESLNAPIVALDFGQFLIQKFPQSRFSFTDLTGGKCADLSLSPHFRPQGIRLQDRLSRKFSALLRPSRFLQRVRRSLKY